MATYSTGDLSRREILRMSAVLGIASATSTRLAIAQTAGQRTPEQILGPFYPFATRKLKYGRQTRMDAIRIQAITIPRLSIRTLKGQPF